MLAHRPKLPTNCLTTVCEALFQLAAFRGFPKIIDSQNEPDWNGSNFGRRNIQSRAKAGRKGFLFLFAAYTEENTYVHSIKEDLEVVLLGVHNKKVGKR